jgi:hypothetical protein
MKVVGDREILEKYLNSASKNTSETEILPHGTKSFLTSVIGEYEGCHCSNKKKIKVNCFLRLCALRPHVLSTL